MTATVPDKGELAEEKRRLGVGAVVKTRAMGDFFSWSGYD
jgi:hypothetical protein